MQGYDELSETLSQLLSEQQILSKLLTRNNNQHRKSKPHILLKTVSRFVIRINDQVDDVLSINKDVERLLRTHHKLSGSTVSESIRCMLGLHKIVALSTQAITWIEKAAKETGGYIAQMVFLPLYTMYLALASRLHSLVGSLALHHAKRLEVLRSSLRTASVMFPQYTGTLTTALAAYALPPAVAEVITALAFAGGKGGAEDDVSSGGASLSGCGEDTPSANCSSQRATTNANASSNMTNVTGNMKSENEKLSALAGRVDNSFLAQSCNDDDIGEDIGWDRISDKTLLASKKSKSPSSRNISSINAAAAVEMVTSQPGMGRDTMSSRKSGSGESIKVENLAKDEGRKCLDDNTAAVHSISNQSSLPVEPLLISSFSSSPSLATDFDNAERIQKATKKKKFDQMSMGEGDSNSKNSTSSSSNSNTSRRSSSSKGENNSGGGKKKKSKKGKVVDDIDDIFGSLPF